MKNFTVLETVLNRKQTSEYKNKVNTEVFVFKPVCFSAFYSYSFYTLCPLC